MDLIERGVGWPLSGDLLWEGRTVAPLPSNCPWPGSSDVKFVGKLMPERSAVSIWRLVGIHASWQRDFRAEVERVGGERHDRADNGHIGWRAREVPVNGHVTNGGWVKRLGDWLPECTI